MYTNNNIKKGIRGLCGVVIVQILSFITFILILSLVGCQTTPTQIGALYGGGAGALVGQILGDNTESTLIGAGVGALGGALLNDELTNQREIGQQEGYQQGYNDSNKVQTQVNQAPKPSVYYNNYYNSCPPPPNYIIVDHVPISPYYHGFYHRPYRLYRPYYRRSHINIHYWR